MKERDLTGEAWREYDFGGRVYRIDHPVSLWVGKTTHRVLGEDNVVHCVPGPGVGDCVLRWKPADPSDPVQF